MVGREGAGWAADLLGDRAWAGELFVGADALLSALKQVHVEAGEALRFLAAALEASPDGRLTVVTTPLREATVRVSHAVIEEAVDAVVFFAFVWATLHAGGPLVAAGARVLVSANTWTPEKRKIFSTWRSIDLWIGELEPAGAEARRWVEAVLAREWAIYRELWPSAAAGWARPTPTAAGVGALVSARGATGRDLRLDLAAVRGGFRAAVRSPTRAWLDGLIRRNPGLGLELANLYARYARRAGFGGRASDGLRER